jgi:hypothetical protein
MIVFNTAMRNKDSLSSLLCFSLCFFVRESVTHPVATNANSPQQENQSPHWDSLALFRLVGLKNSVVLTVYRIDWVTTVPPAGEKHLALGAPIFVWRAHD